MFRPVTYAPADTLRDAVAYPGPSSKYDSADIAKALADLGLEHLHRELDVKERWGGD
jgi:ABC-type uncharacterized transport system fused permease/ATPase subunit